MRHGNIRYLVAKFSVNFNRLFDLELGLGTVHDHDLESLVPVEHRVIYDVEFAWFPRGHTVRSVQIDDGVIVSEHVRGHANSTAVLGDNIEHVDRPAQEARHDNQVHPPPLASASPVVELRISVAAVDTETGWKCSINIKSIEPLQVTVSFLIYRKEGRRSNYSLRPLDY